MTRSRVGGDGRGARGASRSGVSASHTRLRARLFNRFVRHRRRRWMLVSLLSFSLSLVTALILPMATANADANSLSSYGATASGWGIKPQVVNDSFQNVPAADQAAPFVFVSMNNTPGAEAKASYFFPGTAVSAVPNTQGVSVNVPDGMEARFPGNGSASSQLTGFNDGFASQASAGVQSAKASEGYAQAQAAMTHYQFAPALPSASSPSVPGVPGVPTVPPLATPPALPSPAPMPTVSGGSTPSATPGASPSPTATPKSCFIVCLPGQSGSMHGGVDASAPPASPAVGIQGVALPDIIEQALTTSLRAAEVSNPNLLSLAQGKQATTDPSLPYASADMSSQAETRASDDGVTIVVQTNLQNIELFQGLITISSMQSRLQAVAPSSLVKGSGTITTNVTGAAIAGIPVSVDQNGVTVNDQNVSAAQAQALSDQLNAALKQAGVKVSLMSSVITTDIGNWQGSGSGVEVTADLGASSLNTPPPPANVPDPTKAVPATHVDFTIADVSASIFATPPEATSPTSSGGGGGGGYINYGSSGGAVCTVNGSAPSSPSSPNTPVAAPRFFGAFTLPAGLHGVPLVALVFVIQGLSTAAVAATAGFTSPSGEGTASAAEEETQ